MSEPFLGEIRAFGFNFAPRGWAMCAGQIMAIAQNTALFSLLGTQYGGNGQTTFALPDLRGRAAIAQGQRSGGSNYNIGETGGTENTTLTLNNLPGHTHLVAPPVSSSSTTKNPAGAVPGLTSSAAYNPTSSGTGAAFPTGIAGNNSPFSLLNPYLVINYCIALEGIFPSRN